MPPRTAITPGATIVMLCSRETLPVSFCPLGTSGRMPAHALITSRIPSRAAGKSALAVRNMYSMSDVVARTSSGGPSYSVSVVPMMVNSVLVGPAGITNMTRPSMGEVIVIAPRFPIRSRGTRMCEPFDGRTV